MNIKNMSVVVAIATAMIGVGVSSVQAQTASGVSQSQFNAGLNSSLWSFSQNINGNVAWTTNGGVAQVSSDPLVYDNVSTWNISISINGGLMSVGTSGQTAYASGGLDWGVVNTPISSSALVDSIFLGVQYQATSSESFTISGITVNGGVPIAGTFTADGSNPFSGVLINASSINQLNYTLTAYVADLGNEDTGTADRPAVLNTVYIPGSNVVPEPSFSALFGLGFATFLFFIGFGKAKTV
jgi:hypothetical protein